MLLTEVLKRKCKDGIHRLRLRACMRERTLTGVSVTNCMRALRDDAKTSKGKVKSRVRRSAIECQPMASHIRLASNEAEEKKKER